MAAEWVVGVLLCLAGAATANLGLNLQKFAHARNDRLPDDLKRPYLRNWWWVFGFSVFTVGQLLNFASLGFASQALLATLGSFSLATNTVYAPLLLKEVTTAWHIISTLVIMGGSVLVVLFSNHSPQNYTLAQLETLYRHEAFVFYAGSTAAVLLGLLVFYIIFRAKETHALKLGIAPPGALLACACAILSATLGSCSYLLAKCTVQLIKKTVQHDNQFIHWQSFLIMGVFVACALSDIHFMNLALKRGEALIVIPVYYVTNTVLSVVGGMIYFQEYRGMSPEQTFLFVLGVLITIVGVALLGSVSSSGPSSTRPNSSRHGPHGLQAKSSVVVQPSSPGLDPADVSVRTSLLSQADRDTGYGTHVPSSISAARSGRWTPPVRRPVALGFIGAFHVYPHRSMSALQLGNVDSGPSHVVGGSLAPEAGARADSASRLGGLLAGGSLAGRTHCDTGRLVYPCGSTNALSVPMPVPTGQTMLRTPPPSEFAPRGRSLPAGGLHDKAHVHFRRPGPPPPR